MNKEIITYIEFIKKFEGKLNSKFKISGNIWERSGKDFPKSGKVGDYKYSFHGAGCRIENNGIICEYDIAPLNGKSIKFSLWKLANFIKTHPTGTSPFSSAYCASANANFILWMILLLNVKI